MTYRISTVAEMTGIARNTLIAWERRYGFVRPSRRENGYRSYNEEDVSRILRVKNAVSAGLKVSEAVQLLRAAETRDDVEEKTPLSPPFVASSETFAKMRDDLTAALISYRREAVDRLLGQVQGVPFTTRLHEIYFPVLRSLGQLWEKGDISIAQEHYASGLIRSNLAALLLTAPAPASEALHVACTTFPKEQHEIVALALAVQLSLLGKRVTYLGANMPVDDLADFCQKQTPDLVCVSCIQTPDEDTLNRYAQTLSSKIPSGTRVVLGGKCLLNMTSPSPRVEVVPNWEDLKY